MKLVSVGKPPADYQPLLARDMIDVMESSKSLMATRPLFQFIADWDWLPHRRVEMLEGSPPENSDPFLLAATASVVHALCDRDGIEPPEWTETAYLAEEHTLSGIPADTPFGRFVKSKAPPACAEHGVYFESEEIGVRSRADLPYNKRHE